MKYKYYPALLLLMIYSFNSYSQTYSNPIEYLNAITEVYQVISKDTWDYTKAVAHNKSARKIENRRKELMQTTLESRRTITRMPSYEGNISLRDSLASYFNLNYLMLKEDYAKIVDLEEIAEQSYDLMEAYMLTIRETNKKREEAYNMVENEFDKFAEEFNIKIIEGEKTKLGKKLEKAGKVYEYYDPIYLIFFKSYKQELYLIESLNNNDMVAFEQNRNALAQYAQEGLDEVRQMPAFGTDISLKRACQQLLLFYQDEANEKAPYFADFYLKKENMEKLQKAIESKPRSKLTKEEIDAYNKSVNDYNKTLKTFNKINDTVNKERKKQLDAWNKTSRSFVDSHVP